MVHKNSPENRRKKAEKDKYKTLARRIEFNYTIGCIGIKKKREALKIMSVINND